MLCRQQDGRVNLRRKLQTDCHLLTIRSRPGTAQGLYKHPFIYLLKRKQHTCQGKKLATFDS